MSPVSLNLTQDHLARFWAKVDRRGADECWPWTGRTTKGYGRISLDGLELTATHVAIAIATGNWPTQYALHHCDNPACVNPAHLFQGTHADNMRDAARKGRLRPPCRIGKLSNNARLTEAFVKEIRHRHSRGELARSLAREFGCSRYAIHDLIKGRTWKHVA